MTVLAKLNAAFQTLLSDATAAIGTVAGDKLAADRHRQTAENAASSAADYGVVDPDTGDESPSGVPGAAKSASDALASSLAAAADAARVSPFVAPSSVPADRRSVVLDVTASVPAAVTDTLYLGQILRNVGGVDRIALQRTSDDAAVFTVDVPTGTPPDEDGWYLAKNTLNTWGPCWVKANFAAIADGIYAGSSSYLFRADLLSTRGARPVTAGDHVLDRRLARLEAQRQSLYPFAQSVAGTNASRLTRSILDVVRTGVPASEEADQYYVATVLRNVSSTWRVQIKLVSSDLLVAEYNVVGLTEPDGPAWISLTRKNSYVSEFAVLIDWSQFATGTSAGGSWAVLAPEVSSPPLRDAAAYEHDTRLSVLESDGVDERHVYTPAGSRVLADVARSRARRYELGLVASTPYRYDLAIVGDSWVYNKKITDVIRRILQDALGDGGPGYLTALPAATTLPAGWTSRSVTGWTGVDADTDTSALGVEGQHAVSEVGSDTASFTATATEWVVVYRAADLGDLRVRVDGGAWTNLPAAATTSAEVVATGLSLAAHTIEVDPTVAGAELCGVIARNGSGACVHRLGNPAVELVDLAALDATEQQAALAVLGCHDVWVLGGTNDSQFSDATGSEVAAAVSTLLDRIAAALPSASRAIISVPENAAEEPGAVPSNSYVYRQTDYAAALRALAVDEGVAHVDGTAMWGGGAMTSALVTAGALSLADSLHLTREGGETFAVQLAEALLT